LSDGREKLPSNIVPIAGGEGDKDQETTEMAPEERRVVSDALAEAPLEAEVLAAAHQTLNVNVNVLLNVVSRTNSPEQALAHAERSFELIRRFEEQRVQHFRQMSDAIIAAKEKDPDERERREHAVLRRQMISLVGLVMLMSVGGTIVLAFRGVPTLVLAVPLFLGVVSMAILAVVGSGNTLTAKDVRGLIRTAMPLFGEKDGDTQQLQKPKKRDRNRGRKK
jgi:hypothetical protein